MRKSRYVVAISVDAYIAGPKEKPTGLAPTRKSMFWRSGHTSTLCLGEEKLIRQLPRDWARGRLQELPASCSRAR